MSRTIRNRYLKSNVSAAYYSNFRMTSSRSKFIDTQVAKYWHPTRSVRRLRTQAEYDAAYAKDQKRYERECKMYPSGIITRRWCIFTGKIVLDYVRPYPPHASRWKRVEIDWPIDEARKEFGEEYDSQVRDGYLCDTGRNTGFKREAKRTLRRANREFCKKVMIDEDWEDEVLPDRYLGKALKWNWW